MKDTIREARQKIGMTQSELAARLHVTQSAVSHWEKGLTMPTAQQIPMIADVLKTTVSELFGERVG